MDSSSPYLRRAFSDGSFSDLLILVMAYAVNGSKNTMKTVSFGLIMIRDTNMPIIIKGSCTERESDENMAHCTSVTSDVILESISPFRCSEKNDKFNANILSCILLRKRCSMPMLIYDSKSPAKYLDMFLKANIRKPIRHTQKSTHSRPF